MTNLDTPRLDNAQVMQATGLSAATIQTWTNRKLIEIAEQNPGHGRRRRYSIRNVLNLGIAATLVRSGFAISDACLLCQHIDLDAFVQDLKKPNGLTWLLVRLGDGMTTQAIRARDDLFKSVILKQYEICHLINIRSIVQRVLGSAEGFISGRKDEG